jgi:hypothetical protein
VGLDPAFFDPDQAMAKLTQDMKQSLTVRQKVPNFRMAFVTPSVKFGNNENRTKAYAIETEKSTSEECLRILKKTYKDSGSFVPFQMRNKHPEAFARAISMQTHVLSTNRTIVLNNIGTDAMMYLTHWIEQIDGVEEIAPYRSVDIDGRYRILTKKNDFHRIRNYLIQHLAQWFDDHVAPDAKPRFGRFPGEPEVAPIKADDYSSGDDSYMASSINTIMAYDDEMFKTDPVNRDQSPSNNNKPSSLTTNNRTASTWAARVVHGSITKQVPQNESVGSDVNTNNGNTRNSKDDEIHSLKQEIESLKNERVQFQTNIESQVQEKVAQAIQAHFAKIPESVGVTQNQFEVFLEQQNRNFRELSIQLMQMVISTRSYSDPGDKDVVVTVATGKRSGDTTGDTSSMTDSNPDQKDDRKRLDNKPTPKKLDYPPATTAIHSPNHTLGYSDDRPNQMQCDSNNLPIPPSFTHGHDAEISTFDTTQQKQFKDHRMLTDAVGNITNNAVLHAEMHTTATGLQQEGKPGAIQKDGYSTPEK